MNTEPYRPNLLLFLLIALLLSFTHPKNLHILFLSLHINLINFSRSSCPASSPKNVSILHCTYGLSHGCSRYPLVVIQ